MPRKKKEEVVEETKKSGRSSWIDQVKAVQKRDGITYKEAMSVASKERKSKE